MACFAAVGGLGLSAVTCGGKAVVDPGGAAAAGATSGTGGTTTTPTTTVTTTSSTMTTTSTTTTMTTSTSITTTTVTTTCDVGDCGSCINSDCAYDACWDAIDVCIMSDPCLALNDCLNSCGQGDPGCWQQCKQAHPAGVAPLEELYDCLMCGACYIDCDGNSICPYQL